MNKDYAKNIMKNSDLDEKSGLLLKMGDKTTYYQRNRKNLSNRPKEYYENNKERLTEKGKTKYRKLSIEGKDI